MEIVEMVIFHFRKEFVLMMEKMTGKRWLVEFDCKVVEMLVNESLVVLGYMEVVKLEKEHLEVCEKMEKEYSLEVLKCKVVAMLVKKERFEEFECMVVVMLVKACLVVFECKGLEKLEKEFLEVLVHMEVEK
jgi:hypothetical protein